MKLLQEGNQEEYKARFSQYAKNGISPDQIADLYKSAHAAIRQDPSFTKKAPKEVTKKRWGRKKFSIKQRKDRIKQKLAAVKK